MSMNFKYKEKDKASGKKPFIPITLISENESIDTVGLIDSGADISVLPRSMADLLGLKLEHEEDVSGIGGDIKAAHSHVTIKIERPHEKHSFRLPVKVLLSIELNIPVLLGRSVFFDNFNITFEQSQKRVVLKKVDSSYIINK